MVFLLSTITTLLAIAQTASAHFLPPKGAITVGGKFGKYKTISAALNDTSSNVYFVYAGWVII
jgi:pectinesterase